MSPIDITFATPTHPEFEWLDSFEGLEEGEIGQLVVILRAALAAFSAELSDRRNPWTDPKLENFKQKLQETAKKINEQGLTKTHEGHLDRSYNWRKQDPPKENARKANQARLGGNISGSSQTS